MFILLTGSSGAGKTSACWRTLPGLRSQGVRIAGFISPPLLDEHGVKTGIEMIDLSTRQHQTFARVMRHAAATVGVYQVCEEAVVWARRVLSAALLANVDWLVVDEIGPLELEQGRGFAFALDALADPLRVPNAIVIVRQRYVEELAQRLGRADIVRLLVTVENRSQVTAQLVKLIRNDVL